MEYLLLVAHRFDSLEVRTMDLETGKRDSGSKANQDTQSFPSPR